MDDAHRHFYPLSDYRFISLVSYWDPRHYGTVAMPAELLTVAARVQAERAVSRVASP